MKAVTWQGRKDMRVVEVPDPQIIDPTDAIIQVTSPRPRRIPGGGTRVRETPPERVAAVVCACPLRTRDLVDQWI